MATNPTADKSDSKGDPKSGAAATKTSGAVDLTHLHTVRFKSNRGVQEVMISAHPDQAAAVAKQWVNKQPGRMLLQLFPAVVADERILLDIKPAEAPSNVIG